MAKKKSIYEGVSYDTLKDELQSIVSYLESNDVNNIEDRIEWKPTKTGGLAPTVISNIEEQVQLQIEIIEQCCRILKSLYEKESLTDFVQLNIDVMIEKLAQIQKFYRGQPITGINDRFVTKGISDKKKGTEKQVRFLANKRESIIKARTKVTESILKIQPMVSELESFKESVSVKGGYEIPESMLYD